MTVSAKPPKNPATAPNRTPMTIEITVARMPIFSDTRAP